MAGSADAAPDAPGTGENWLTGWTYRRALTISGSADGDQTDYAMRTTVHYGTGTTTATDVYLSSHSQTDFDDIRFTSSNGNTELDYWLESKTDSAQAYFWYEVSSIPSAGTTVYLYYGHANASSTSNMAGTFLFSDDFSSALNYTSKWTTGSTGLYSVSNGKLSLSPTSTTTNALFSRYQLTGNYAIEASLQTQAAASCMYLGASNISGTWGNVAECYTNWEQQKFFATVNGNMYELPTSRDQSTYHRFVIRMPSSGNATATIYHETTVEISKAAIPSNRNTYPVLLNYPQTGGTCYADWIFARKYTTNEPTPSAYGAESTEAYVPSAPQSVVATQIGGGTIEITWTAPSSNGSSAITGYSVYYSTTESGSYSLVGNTTDLSYQNSGLNLGLHRWYKVLAYNAAGEGPLSTADDAYTGTAPSAPTGLAASERTSTTITLTWNASTSDGGQTITKYGIWMTDVIGGGGSYTKIGETNNGTTLTYIVYGLTPNTAYYFRLNSYNVIGMSAQTSTVLQFTLSGENSAPDTPANLRYFSNGETRIGMAWDVPVSDGGSAVLHYDLYHSTTETGTYTALAQVSGLYYNHTGLVEGSTHWYKVTATNAIGESAQSAAVSVTTPVSVSTPGAPTGVNGIADGENAILLTWNEPLDDGGATVSAYNIYIADTPNGGYSLAGSTSSLTMTVTGLLPATIWYFKIAAVNSEGEGANCTAFAAQTEGGEMPTVTISDPSEFEFVYRNQFGYRSLYLFWNWTVESGKHVESTRIYIDDVLVQTWADNRTSHIHTIDALQYGPHYVTVTVEDNGGYEASDTVGFVAAAEVGAPAILITSPVDGAEYQLDELVYVNVTVTSEFTVVNTTLLLDGVAVAYDNVSPYRWILDISALAEGAHTLEVVAFTEETQGSAEVAFEIPTGSRDEPPVIDVSQIVTWVMSNGGLVLIGVGVLGLIAGAWRRSWVIVLLSILGIAAGVYLAYAGLVWGLISTLFGLGGG